MGNSTGVGLYQQLRAKIQLLARHLHKLLPICGLTGDGVKVLSPRRLAPLDLNTLIALKFPRLKASGAYEQRSFPDKNYNCIAFAAGDTNRWWWPIGRAGNYWPLGSPREETVATFVSAFESIGYTICSDGATDTGHHKVVLYAKVGLPTHAARQESDTTMWLSKLGQSYDIAHQYIEDVGGDEYGEPVLFLRRAVSEQSVDSGQSA